VSDDPHSFDHDRRPTSDVDEFFAREARRVQAMRDSAVRDARVSSPIERVAAIRRLLEAYPTPSDVDASLLCSEIATLASPLSRDARAVSCAWCGNRYRSVMPPEVCRGNAGLGCSSEVRRGRDGRWRLYSSYGSEHDEQSHELTEKCVSLLRVDSSGYLSAPADAVCDSCVDELALSGLLLPPVDRPHVSAATVAVAEGTLLTPGEDPAVSVTSDE
jgi:hypothetical protein